MKRISLVFALAMISVANLQATISYNLQAEVLKDASGTALADGKLVLFIASTLDGSFGSITAGSLTAVSSLLNADDAVVFKTGTNGFGNYGVNGILDVSTGGLALASVPNWSTGDPLALLWFPTLSSSATSIPNGTPYGFYTKSTAVDGSLAWITPNDPGSNKAMLFYTKDGSGNVSPGISASNLATAGNAALTVGSVPEPSRVMLAAMGLGAFVLRRRRQA